MLDATLSQLAAQWFDEYHRLAYWLARRWSQRCLDYRSRGYCPPEDSLDLSNPTVDNAAAQPVFDHAKLKRLQGKRPEVFDQSSAVKCLQWPECVLDVVDL